MKSSQIVAVAALLFVFLRLIAQIEIPDIIDRPREDKKGNEKIIDSSSIEPKYKLETARIIFKNGDQLSGNLLNADPYRINWKSTHSESAANFLFDAIEKIILPQSSVGENSDIKHKINFTNGDSLSGKILSLDDKSMLLQTTYAGKLNIPRDFLLSISSSPLSKFFYTGPNEGDNWVKVEHSGGQFKIADGFLILPRNCGAAIELPDKDFVRIEFDAPFGAFFNTVIFSSAPAAYNSGGYMLGFNNNYVYLQSMSKRGGSRNLGNAQMEDMPSKPFIKYTILANRKSSSFVLKIENKTIQKWFDSNNKNSENGRFLVFFHSHGAFRDMKLKNILISEWDGRDDDKPDNNEKNNSDIIIFTNGDKTTGVLLSINDSRFDFKTDFATLKIPSERVSNVKFSVQSDKQTKPTLQKPIIAKFADEDRITLSLVSIENGIMTAENLLFGKAKFNLAYCSELLFSLPENKNEDGTESQDISVDPVLKVREE